VSEMAGPAGGGPGGSGGEVRVDRLALRVTGLDEGAARTLARLVAEKLAAGLPPLTGSASLGSLRAEVQLGAGEEAGPDVMAGRIADQVGRLLARDRAAGGPEGEAVP
jgi:hypothetical protein